jgi:hypothetical protein
MDFPAYVPAAVRAHISTLIEGDSRTPEAWAASLASAEESLAVINQAFEGYKRRGEDAYLPSLRVQIAQAQAHRDAVKGEVECLLRLAYDGRMADAYALLTREFTDDQQWRSFIRAALSARIDFPKYRDRLKRAAEQKEKIADAAQELARLISRFSEIGITGPSEFYSVPELLRQTDNHEMEGHNLQMWRGLRGHVLGDVPRRAVPQASPAEEGIEPKPPIEIRFVPLGARSETDPEEEARNVLRYAWGTAPDISALLGTMANAARRFNPSESGVIGAALESRQRSPKTEYLRAFGNLLTDVHGFTLAMPLMQAMAIVANVVINRRGVDVTYDDVRKALARIGNERLENSGEK